MELERQAVAVLVEPVVDAEGYQVIVQVIAAAGRSGVEKVYGVPYLDVGCDVWFDVCRIHHFSPLITAIRRGMYQLPLKPVNTFTTRSSPVEMPLCRVAPAILGLERLEPLDIVPECDSHEH